MTELCVCKFDWYQSESRVTIEVRYRGQKLDDCSLKFSRGTACKWTVTDVHDDTKQNDNDTLSTLLKLLVNNSVAFAAYLYDDVEAEKSILKCTDAKIEITLQKKTNGLWPRLSALVDEDKDNKENSFFSVKKRANWDKLAEEAEKEEFEDMDPTTRLFKRIYLNADEDSRRAMTKSLYESNGTTCNTNWEDVRKAKVPASPAGEDDQSPMENGKREEDVFSVPTTGIVEDEDMSIN